MSQLYKLSYDVSIITKFIPSIMMIVLFIIQYRMKKYNIHLNKRIFIQIGLFWLGVFQILIMMFMSVEYKQIYMAYKNNNVESVYGKVESFVTNNVNESFEIRGVKFEYSSKDLMLGYNVIKKKGGVIIGNNQVVKIDYIYYNGKNVIVSIYE